MRKWSYHGVTPMQMDRARGAPCLLRRVLCQLSRKAQNCLRRPISYTPGGIVGTYRHLMIHPFYRFNLFVDEFDHSVYDGIKNLFNTRTDVWNDPLVKKVFQCRVGWNVTYRAIVWNPSSIPRSSSSGTPGTVTSNSMSCVEENLYFT